MTAIRIIIANLLIFLIMKGIWLFSPELTDSAVEIFALPWTVTGVLHAPWTVITYMFLHINFWHLLVNSLWLAWFGALLEHVAGGKLVLAYYIAGGVTGAFFFSAIPAGFSTPDSEALLIGASAATLAVIGATLVSIPDKRVDVPFIGNVQLKWIAAIGLALFVCASFEMSAAQTAAHLGGLIIGVAGALLWKVLSRRQLEQVKAMARRRLEQNALIEKARRSGYASLSRTEQLKLFSLSREENLRDIHAD